MIVRARTFGALGADAVESGQVVIAGDAGNKCYISRDYGNTFSKLDSRPENAIISANGSIIVLLRYDGVMISRDGGYVFMNLDLKNCTCGKILDNGDVILMRDSRTTPLLYIIKVNGEIIQRPIPEGSRWLDATPDGKHLFVARYNYILYSADLGVSFRTYTISTSYRDELKKIVVLPPKDVFLIFPYRTNGYIKKELEPPWNTNYQHVNILDISVSSNGLFRLYGSWNGGILSSKDGGVTFKQRSRYGREIPCVLVNQDGSIQYLSTGTGLMVSKDGGETFRETEALRNVEINFIATNK